MTTTQQLRIANVAVSELVPFEGNARRGDVSMIADSLKRNGQYKPIVVNRGTHTGRANEVLAGNHTLQAAARLGWEKIAVVYVDVDRDSALRIVLADNRTNDLATYDNAELIKLLSEVDDFDGTGFTGESFDKLLDALNEDDIADSEHEEQYFERFEIVVECTDENHQAELFDRLKEDGLQVRLLSL